jgi:phosphoglycolate phosphatase
MRGQLQAVLFDLDGTLLDTAPDFAVVLNTMLQRHGRTPLPFEAIRRNVSNGARALVQLGFEIDDQHPQFSPLLEELLDRYQRRLSVDTRLFEGMSQLLDLLEARKLAWGIVTNKPARYTDAILHDLKLAQRCAAAICPDHVAHRKPHAEPLRAACAVIGCEPTGAIYVGDHRRDIEAGINAGMPTIAAGYGYVSADDPPESWGANQVAASVAQLETFIRERMGISL